MNGPYRIERTQIRSPDPDNKYAPTYRFDLINITTDKVVDYCFGRSPIAPAKMRDYQARLNTNWVLDGNKMVLG